jgi:hypothetical protein
MSAPIMSGGTPKIRVKRRTPKAAGRRELLLPTNAVPLPVPSQRALGQGPAMYVYDLGTSIVQIVEVASLLEPPLRDPRSILVILGSYTVHPVIGEPDAHLEVLHRRIRRPARYK